MKRTAVLMIFILSLVLGLCFGTALADDTILIGTPQELLNLNNALIANKDAYLNKTIKLTADINLNGAEWNPVPVFKGILDGNGKTISNFKIATYTNGSGSQRTSMFVSVSDGNGGVRVRDLTLENVTAAIGNGRHGTLANTLYGKIENVKVKNVTVTTTSTSAEVAGLVTWIYHGGSASDCTVENLTVNAQKDPNTIAGFAGNLSQSGDVTFTNCHVKGLTVSLSNSAGSQIAGFFAQTQPTAGKYTTTMTNCSATGLNITAGGDVNVGGFIGCAGLALNMDNCRAEGKIDVSGATSGYAGGFFADLGWKSAGSSNKGHVVKNCTADVDITTKKVSAGGFIGNATNEGNSSMYAELTNCTANGNVICVSGGTATVGGFAGEADRGVYTNCKANGAVSGGVAGGFIGKANDATPSYDSGYPESSAPYPVNQITLDGCSSSGTVMGSDKAAGIVGDVSGKKSDSSLIIKNTTAAPTVVGGKKNTQVDPYVNRNNNGKDMQLVSPKGNPDLVTPSSSGASMNMDQDGNVILPDGGADVKKSDGTQTKHIPAGYVIYANGSIRQPAQPPKTGVDSADKLIPLALASLLCMALLLVLRRKAEQNG